MVKVIRTPSEQTGVNFGLVDGQLLGADASKRRRLWIIDSEDSNEPTAKRRKSTSEDESTDEDQYDVNPEMTVLQKHADEVLPHKTVSCCWKKFNPGQLIIHFIRHAEAEHNVMRPGEGPKDRFRIRDPKLTRKGVAQAELLQKTFSRMANITHILCSPMDRTLDTAYRAFRSVLKGKGISIIADADLREWGKSPSSKGRSKRNLGFRFGHVRANKQSTEPVYDFRLLKDNWEKNQDEGHCDNSRLEVVRLKLYDFSQAALKSAKGADVEIAVVSHGSFLRDLLGIEKPDRFHNAEWKSYRYPTEQEIWRAGASAEDLIPIDANVRQQWDECHRLKKFQSFDRTYPGNSEVPTLIPRQVWSLRYEDRRWKKMKDTVEWTAEKEAKREHRQMERRKKEADARGETRWEETETRRRNVAGKREWVEWVAA